MCISVGLSEGSLILPPQALCPDLRVVTVQVGFTIFISTSPLMSISYIDLWTIWIQIMAIPLFPMLYFLGGFSFPHL